MNQAKRTRQKWESQLQLGALQRISPGRGIRLGANFKDRESLEDVPRRQSGGAGAARSELRGFAWRICRGDGSVGMRKIHAALCDWRPGPGVPRARAR